MKRDDEKYLPPQTAANVLGLGFHVGLLALLLAPMVIYIVSWGWGWDWWQGPVTAFILAAMFLLFCQSLEEEKGLLGWLGRETAYAFLSVATGFWVIPLGCLIAPFPPMVGALKLAGASWQDAWSLTMVLCAAVMTGITLLFAYGPWRWIFIGEGIDSELEWVGEWDPGGPHHAHEHGHEGGGEGGVLFLKLAILAGQGLLTFFAFYWIVKAIHG